MWGLFIHFFSDVLTSLIVLGVGLAYHFDPNNTWYVHIWFTFLTEVNACYPFVALGLVVNTVFIIRTTVFASAY